MSQGELFVGIDVSKARLDVAVLPNEKTWSMTNDDEGISGLVAKLLELAPVLGPSGSNWRPRATSARQVGWRRASGDGHQSSQRQRLRQVPGQARQDRPDRRDRPGSLCSGHPAASVGPSSTRSLRSSQALLTRRRQIVEMIVAEKNRLAATDTNKVRKLIKAHIEYLQKQLAINEYDLDQTIKQSPVWHEKIDLLETVPGVGRVIALDSRGPLPELGTLDRKRLLPSSVSLRSTATAEPSRVAERFGAAEHPCAPCSTWLPWSASDGTPPFEPSTSRLKPPGSAPRSPSSPACESSSPSSTPSSEIAPLGARRCFRLEIQDSYSPAAFGVGLSASGRGAERGEAPARSDTGDLADVRPSPATFGVGLSRRRERRRTNRGSGALRHWRPRGRQTLSRRLRRRPLPQAEEAQNEQRLRRAPTLATSRTSDPLPPPSASASPAGGRGAERGEAPARTDTGGLGFCAERLRRARTLAASGSAPRGSGAYGHWRPRVLRLSRLRERPTSRRLGGRGLCSRTPPGASTRIPYPRVRRL